MANWPNVVSVSCTIYDPASETAPVTLIDAAVMPRRFFANPLNVQGFADTRPRVGQLWPRGDGQSYGA